MPRGPLRRPPRRVRAPVRAGIRCGPGFAAGCGPREPRRIEPQWIFAYGTLMPGQRAWPVVADRVVEVRAAVVSGTLWDTGLGYPALALGGGAVPPGGGEVPGAALRLAPSSAPESLAVLDRYEGLGPHRYRRVRVRTGDGLACWTYEWVGPTEGFVVLEAGWDAGRGP